LFLGRNIAIVAVVFSLEKVLPAAVERDCHSVAADDYPEEGEAAFAEVEAVDLFQHDGEGFEPEVEDAVDEGDVDVEDEHNGLAEAELEGAEEGFVDESLSNVSYG
jgi:adenine-specific DNA methylase